MQVEAWDVVVVGAGQAGPSLAVKFAQAGRRTALVERATLGGTCVNTGCTPTKTLVASARVAHLARRGAEFGVTLPGTIGIDYARVRERMLSVVQQSIDGLSGWIGGTDGLTLIRGDARFVAPDTLAVGERRLRAPQIFLNVGCRPVEPDWAVGSGVPYLTNVSLLRLAELPAELVIVGGGAIGLEFAQVYARLGSRVTVVERAPQLLAREDDGVAQVVREALEADGVRFELGASCFALQSAPQGAGLVYSRGDRRHVLAGSHVLVAVGRQPNTDTLALEAAGLAADERGYLPVDGALRTAVPGIWAVGDVNGRGAFTHTSWNDHEVVAANLLDGQARSIDGRVAPYALYVDPPLARAGDNEQQARSRGVPLLVGKLPMTRVGRARERGETRGFMKVLVDASTMKLLGATFVCPEADELMHAMITAIDAGADVRTLARSVAIHPTIAELIPTMLQQLVPL